MQSGQSVIYWLKWTQGSGHSRESNDGRLWEILIEKHTDTNTNTNTHKHTNIHRDTDRHTQTHAHTHRHTHRHIHGHTQTHTTTHTPPSFSLSLSLSLSLFLSLSLSLSFFLSPRQSFSLVCCGIHRLVPLVYAGIYRSVLIGAPGNHSMDRRS